MIPRVFVFEDSVNNTTCQIFPWEKRYAGISRQTLHLASSI